MSRRRSILVSLALAAVLAGCGNDRTPPPDVTTPGPAFGTIDQRYPGAGVRFQAPKEWRLVKGQPPLVATISTGTAMIAVWRYPRTEPLPRSAKALDEAKDRLVAAVQARDRTFKLARARTMHAARAPAVQLLGTETVGGEPRRVRSTHVYAHGGEVIVDAYAAPLDFDRVDRTIFRPLLRSLRVSRAAS